MKIKLDSILGELGNPGVYQVLVFLLICLNYFPLVFNHVIMAFFGIRPPYQCHSTLYMNRTTSGNYLQTSSSNSSNGTIISYPDSCSATYTLQGDRNVSVTCPDSEGSEFVYDKPVAMETIVTEWDLVCGNTYLSPLATTIYFCGVMVGGVLFGHLADRYGRKPVMMLTLLLPIAVGVATSFAPYYSVFVVLRFVQGILMQGLQTSSYTLSMELFKPHHRSYVGAILEVFWGFGVMTVPLLAYLIPNWRHLQLAISLPSIIALAYFFIVPESLRWLILKNRANDAESLIVKITCWNKLEFPKRSWEDVKIQLENTEHDTRQYSFVDLMKTPKLRQRSLVLFYLWFAISTGYYGLTWQLTKLPGSKYLNFFIGGAVETVAYALVIPITLKFGRKWPLLTYFVLASIFLIGAGLVPLVLKTENILIVSNGLAIMGKFAMGGLFCMIFLYTSELFPTIIRNIGMGSCAFWTRVGGVIAPQIVVLDYFGVKSLPLVLFGILTLIGGFLTILLPETLGCKLPDNIDEVESSASLDTLAEEADGEELAVLNGNQNNIHANC